MHDDVFKVFYVMLEIAAQIWKLVEEFFDWFVQKPGQDKQPSQAGYESAKKSYIGNMSKEERADLEKRIEPVAQSIGMTGKEVLNGVEINQHENLLEMQKKLNIKEDINVPKQTKEEFVNEIKDKLEYKPPVFDEKDLPDDKNANICERGGRIKVDDLDERGYGNGVDLSTYASMTKTNVPTEILVTGNTKVLKEYLDKNPDRLLADSLERKHLNARIKTMEHVENLGKYNNEHGLLKSVSDTKEKDTLTYKVPNSKETRKIQIIKGLHQEGKQTTNNGCWSCASEVLLQAQGIKLDQKLIRAFKPDYDNLGEGPIDQPEIIDTFNSDSQDTIMDHAELFGKVAPNTLVFSANAGEYGGSISDKASSLLDRNIPVAFLKGKHWATVVGQDEKNFYYFDSLKGNNELQCISKSDFSTNKGISMTWLEPMKVNKDTGAIEGIDPESFKVDQETGLVLKGKNFEESKNWDEIAHFKKDGHFSTINQKSVDGSTEYNVSVYVPKSYRKYEMNYDKQMELLDKKAPKKEFVKPNGTIKMGDEYGVKAAGKYLQDLQWKKYQEHYPTLSKQAGKKEEVFKHYKEDVGNPKKHAIRKIANKIPEIKKYINNLDDNGTGLNVQKLNEQVNKVALSMMGEFTPDESQQVFNQGAKGDMFKLTGQDIMNFAQNEKKEKLAMENAKLLPYSNARETMRNFIKQVNENPDYLKNDGLKNALNKTYNLIKNKTTAMESHEKVELNKQMTNLKNEFKMAKINTAQLENVNDDLALGDKKNEIPLVK